ncbi:MAG TPA: hypothetical protein VIU61_12695 [Kofleriaceae bacterium]
MRAVVLVLLLAACGDDRTKITIVADAEFQPALTEFATLTPYPGLEVGSDPGSGYRIIVVADPAVPVEGYQLAAGTNSVTVKARDVLGAQYGTAAALEAMGFRFRHPLDPLIPQEIELGAVDEVVHSPQIRVRGFQLHTLHPIEGYFAFWEPSARSTADAHRIIDWVVKNRGNFLQWVALDDIIDVPDRHVAWKAFTAELIAYAHLRGIRVGINIQLFGQANLQQAFDLSDDTTGTVPIADEIAARLPLITDGVTFDVYDLSFGEFFNADPAQFISAVNEVQAQLAVKAPGSEMHAVVHVGAEQIVSYMGEDLLYYFLVKYAHPAIIPDVHTVMFYNLYEPAHGAYQHTDFSEHLAFIRERACAGKPVGYFPETAYWVAFDNSMPQYFPLYVHNRWLDLAKLREEGQCGKIDNHLLFSSGWEWGYWLHDVTALRASYELPAEPRDLVAAEFGTDLGAATEPVVQLMALQRQYLMDRELVQYLAGRDAAIDAGRSLDIVSQPDRVTFEDLMAGGDRTAFEADVMVPLRAYADAIEALDTTVQELDLKVSRWSGELRDGFTIDRLRARFVLETYGATLAHLAGDAAGATAHVATGAALLEEARAVVKRRHADLHDDHDRILVDSTTNRTFYQYGYLYNADTVCFWERELTQVETLLGSATKAPRGCLLP